MPFVSGTYAFVTVPICQIPNANPFSATLAGGSPTTVTVVFTGEVVANSLYSLYKGFFLLSIGVHVNNIGSDNTSNIVHQL